MNKDDQEWPGELLAIIGLAITMTIFCCAIGVAFGRATAPHCPVIEELGS